MLKITDPEKAISQANKEKALAVASAEKVLRSGNLDLFGDKLEKAREAHRKAVEKLSSNIAASMLEKEEANKRLSEYLVKGDLVAYEKQLRASRETDEVISIFQKEVDRLNEAPIISEENYSDFRRAVIEYLNDTVNESKAKIGALLQQISDIATATAADIDKWNQTIEAVYLDDLRPAIEIRNVNSRNDAIQRQKFNDYSVPQFNTWLFNSYFFKEFTK